MNIGHFLLIFWARRVLIIAATASCLIGALIVSAILPPQWKATERIMLDYLKPDQVTGLVLTGGPEMHALVQTQVELITDYTVAGQVAEKLGWLSDPDLTRQYNTRPADDKRDFRHWTADLVIKNTKVKLVEDSNILEINYVGTSPEMAVAVTDALRDAYIDASVQFRREVAQKNAVWYTDQSVKAKQILDQAVNAETAYERENGLVMGEKMDAESTHLAALSMQGVPTGAALESPVEGSAASMQLADIEAQLVAARKNLGPNNPDVLLLESRRAGLEALVQRNRVATHAAVARVQSGSTHALEQALATQKAKVVANSEKIGRLNQLHQDVERARDEYTRMETKAAGYREEAVSTNVGIVPLGNASTPKQPSFPNYLIIVPGSIFLGFAVGVFVSLLMELLAPRVRTAEDLSANDDPSVICIVPGLDDPKKPRVRGKGWRLNWTNNSRAVNA